MKTYIVYVNGEEVGTIKASSHNAAEKKAQKKYLKPGMSPWSVSVAYTEYAENPDTTLWWLGAVALGAAALVLMKKKPATTTTTPATLGPSSAPLPATSAFKALSPNYKTAGAG